MYDPLLLYYVASDLLNCALAQVSRTQAGVPSRVGVVPGQFADDDCCAGMLLASVGQTYASSVFPVPDLTIDQCLLGLTATEINIRIIRCAPGPSPAGAPPTVTQLDDAARIWAEDARAVWSGVLCCLGAFQNAGIQTQMRPQQPYGPAGACMGSELTVVVGINDPCQCSQVRLAGEALISTRILES